MRTALTFSILASLASAFIVSCTSVETIDNTKNDSKTDETSVIQTIEGLEPEIKTFTVSATKPSTIDLKNGGSIEVPAGAFVDENGRAITGEVDLKWNEFHSLGEIALSGIPMDYDSAGYQTDLISGGMFKIDGEQNGENVFIAPNKSLKVNLASTNPQESFNFYKLDEKSGRWNYETTKTAEPKAKAPTQNVPVSNVKQPYNLDLSVRIDQNKYPELKADEILSWEVPAENLSDKQISQIKAEVVKAEIVEPTSKGHYKLKLEGKKFSNTVVARPVTFDNPPTNSKQMRTAMHQDAKDMEEYKKLLENDQLIRSIDIEGFGVYNWDCMYNENSVLSNVALDIPGSNDEKYATFFFVSPKNKRIVKMDRKGAIRLSMLIPACIIAITKNKKVFTVHNKALDEVRKNPRKVSHDFVMSKVDGKINSSKDFDKILDKCI